MHPCVPQTKTTEDTTPIKHWSLHPSCNTCCSPTQVFTTHIYFISSQINITGSHEAADSNVLSAAVCCWDQLCEVTVDGLMGDALIHARAIPGLWLLSMKDVCEAPVTNFVASDHLPLFLTLQTLDITAETIPLCTDMMVLSQSPLQKLSIFSNRPANHVEWAALCGALSQHCNYTALLDLYLV